MDRAGGAHQLLVRRRRIRQASRSLPRSLALGAFPSEGMEGRKERRKGRRCLPKGVRSSSEFARLASEGQRSRCSSGGGEERREKLTARVSSEEGEGSRRSIYL